MKKTIILLVGLCCLSGCTFAGDPEVYGRDGFLMGIWHGAVFFWSLIMCIFTDVTLYSKANNGFWYGFGYSIGLFGLSHNIGLLGGFLSLILFLF